jgi:hypothetical protein
VLSGELVPGQGGKVTWASDLYMQIEPATGKNNQYEQVKGAGNHTFRSRDSAAREAGMSKHQRPTFSAAP